jgi:hypothetical protein
MSTLGRTWAKTDRSLPVWKRYSSTLRAQRDAKRRKRALRGGYKPPPAEKDCPPKPLDGRCECCERPTKRFNLDHCHETGVFRGWVCCGCNMGSGLCDSIERMEKRIAFLKRAHSVFPQGWFLKGDPCYTSHEIAADRFGAQRTLNPTHRIDARLSQTLNGRTDTALGNPPVRFAIAVKQRARYGLSSRRHASR